MTSVSRYINESLEELRHVRWPTRHQATKLSLIVIAFTAVAAVLFGAVDYVLAKILEFMVSL